MDLARATKPAYVGIRSSGKSGQLWPGVSGEKLNCGDAKNPRGDGVIHSVTDDAYRTVLPGMGSRVLGFHEQ